MKTTLLLTRCRKHNNTPFYVKCKLCDKKGLIEEFFANIKGEPFNAYYCNKCIETLRTDNDFIKFYYPKKYRKDKDGII